MGPGPAIDDKRIVPLFASDGGFVKLNRQCLTSTLARTVTTGIIDQRAAHQPCRETKEVRAILPGDVSPVDQAR
jgi:hypothetical protein